MESNIQIQKTKDYIQAHFELESSGHDWWHIYRVWQLAKMIAQAEGANLFFVEMAALLHDLDDWKLSEGNNHTPNAILWMEKIGLQKAAIEQIQRIIEDVSFKGAGVDTTPRTTEAKIVQDADRLDAIGAIGIARTFAYGGHKNRLIYDPKIEPEMHESFSAYQKSTAPTINHFYEKLLLLKDRMNTETGQVIAEKRHQFMEIFLHQFFQEWTPNPQLLTP